MTIARSLRRLLCVLELEEELAHAALQSALAELRLFENALESAAERERAGRKHLVVRAQTEEGVNRAAALEEIAAGRRIATALRPGATEARRKAAARREAFLAKRVERKQAETLLAKAEAREALQAARRAQQATDDWYIGRFAQRKSIREVPAIGCGGEIEPQF